MSYTPVYPKKTAPGKATGYIAWNDDTRESFHLKYNGKRWEVRPIGNGRVEPGFKSGKPVAEFFSVNGAWYYAASGGRESYVEAVAVELLKEDEAVIAATKKYPKSARDAIRSIAEARSNGDTDIILALEPVGVGTVEEYTRFAAVRVIGGEKTTIIAKNGKIAMQVVGGTTITVEQQFTINEVGRVVATPPVVTVAEDQDGKPTTIIHEHRLTGAKHMPWFFTEEPKAVDDWVNAAKKRIRKGSKNTAA